MKKVLLILCFINVLWANNECGLDRKFIVEQLETIYKKDIKSLIDTKKYYEDFFVCKKLKDTSKSVVILSYNSKAFKNMVNHSIIVATVDIKMNKILNHYFHKNLIVKNNYRKYRFQIDTLTYKNVSSHPTFSLLYFQEDGYRAKKKLFLYEEKKKSFSVLLNGIRLYKKQGYADDEQSIYKLTYKGFIKEENKQQLIFSRSYAYKIKMKEHEKVQKWDVALEDVKYIYNGTTYIKEEVKPLFDLKQIEKQVKKGMYFRMLVLHALCFEEPFLDENNVESFNNIAFYLYKHAFYKEALFLLKKIVKQKPERIVALLNLADVYWAMEKRLKASKNYAIYKIEQEKKHLLVVKRANERSKVITKVYNIDMNKGFEKVYKGTQTVHPLLFKNRGETKPIAILPWLQKKILSTSEGKLIKVVAYVKEDELTFLYFVLVDNYIKLYKFNKEQKEELVDRFKIKSYGVYDSYTTSIISNHEYQNYLMIDDALEFYFTGESKNNEEVINYYHYDFDSENISELTDYFSKEERRWYTFASRDENSFIKIDYDGKRNYISLNGQKLFEIKNFEGGFIIGDVDWSPNNKVLYFDNYGEILACIWRYNVRTKELSKIVPEHEAEHPFSFQYKGEEYVVYIEGQNIKVARSEDD